MAIPLPYATLAGRAFAIEDAQAFNALALELFHLHAANNPVYRGFLGPLNLRPDRITGTAGIPFLPIGLFRTHPVMLHGLTPGVTFTSSGTTAAVASHHRVAWPELYERSFHASFTAVYGDPSGWRIIALLPSYLERRGSSLAYMAERLIASSGDPLSGSYLYQYDRVADLLLMSEQEGRKTLLLGVTFALLDLAEKHAMALAHTTVMETGGMKGRRPEMVREEVHGILKKAFGVERIHSEYGMTELLSQAWSQGDGIFRCPPWMRVRIREVNDPLADAGIGRTGGIDVIDLCNIGSCPFISTQDLGRVHADGSFEVLGRFDDADLRGCNLMVDDRAVDRAAG